MVFPGEVRFEFYAEIRGGWDAFNTLSMEGIVILNFILFPCDADGVAFTGVEITIAGQSLVLNNNNKWIYEKHNICYTKYCYKMKIFRILGWGSGSGQK